MRDESDQPSVTSFATEPGQVINYNFEVPKKFRLEFSDGTKIEVLMHPGSRLSLTSGDGTMAVIDVFIEDIDGPSHLRRVD